MLGNESSKRGGITARILALSAVALVGAGGARAAGPPDGGEVRLPLSTYEGLGRQLAALAALPGGAIASADVRVDARGDATAGAVVTAELVVQGAGDEPVAVPIIAAGTAIESATVDGAPLTLAPRGDMLVWVMKGAGPHRLALRYRAVIGAGGDDGAALDVPLPPAAATTLTATLPGTGLRVEVVPGSVVARSEVDGGAATEVRAVLPRSAWARIRWDAGGAGGALVTAANYVGQVGRDTVRWRAALALEVGAEVAAVPVARADVAVVEATLDGAPAALEARDGTLFARVRGRGEHALTLVFDTATRRGDGPTGTSLWTPASPVLAFTLALDGDKEVTTEPAAGVERAVKDGKTTARAWLPATDEVAFHWSEALPEAGERALRANADIVHVVRADEGVLQVTAWVTFEVARGKAHGFTLSVPEAAAVNAVHGDGVTDWRVGDPAAGARALTLYLDREVSGSYTCRVEYELLVDPASTEAHAVPLLTAENVGRQRGMVALVRGTELEIEPARVEGVAAVGENQLPVAVREQIDQKVTHTYRYAEAGGAVLVKLTPFERELARFDAAVDTLYSLGEGVLRAAVSVEITVKAGSFADLELQLPAGINVLSATAPSLREHRVVEPAAAGEARRLALAFTREMEGTVRLEVVWERVLAPGDGPVEVPLLHVLGAVVEQGRLGVEALSAVEVRPLEAGRLLPMDVGELPQKLALRTTNPILLAYHYVHADPPATLVLSVRRHAEIAVQVAAIDRADYQTLWTRDGVALTRARYLIRNRGKQFLRVALPAGASVWSAELAGQPVKPATDEADTVLVPLLAATDPFEVVLVYLVRAEPLGFTGRVEAALPTPDLVETETTWEVYLPEELAWGEVETNMSVVATPEAGPVSAPPADVTASTGGGMREVSGQAGVSPLRIHVPERGKRLALRKLLANQGAERAAFSIRYRAEGAGGAGAGLVLFGALGLGLLLLRLTARGARTRRGVAAAAALAGFGAIVAGTAALGASLAWALPALGLTLALASWRAWRQPARREAAAEA